MFHTTIPPVHTTWRDFLFYVRNGSYLCSVNLNIKRMVYVELVLLCVTIVVLTAASNDSKE